MAVGANIKYTTRKQIIAQVFRLLGFKGFAFSGHLKSTPKFCYKAGVPATNTAADNPNALHDICLDTTNHHVYVCTVYSAGGGATTWVQIA